MVPLPPPRLAGSYLVLELTNRCDLACVHCVSAEPGHPHFRSRGTMDPALVRRLLDDLARVGARFDNLVLFWLGDPLLHPDFSSIYADILRANAEAGTFGKVEVHTNAVRLDRTTIRAALNDAGTPQVWHFTLDAITPETWRSMKRPGVRRAPVRDLGDVAARVEQLLQERAARKARWPRPVLQLIVSGRNAAEVPAFLAHWRRVFTRLGDPPVVAAGAVPSGTGPVLFLRQLDCPTHEAQERENRVFGEVVSSLGLSPLPPVAVPPASAPAPCSGFWKSPCIAWTGAVTMCTRDAELALSAGNLDQAPFPAIWWSPEMAHRRRRVALGDYRGLPPCQGCFIPRSANYTGITTPEIRLHDAWETEARSR